MCRVVLDLETNTYSSELSFPSSIPPATLPPTIVHLSVRIYAPFTEDEAALKKKARRAARAAAASTGSHQQRNPSSTSSPDNTDPDSAVVGGCCGCVIC